MDTHTASPPAAVWRWLGLAAVTLLLLAVAAIAFISTGVLDPGPRGTPTVRHVPGRATVSAGSSRHDWITVAPDHLLAARLTATHAGGELDSGYGLVIGEDENYLVVAVSPLGYAAVWQEQGTEQVMLFPWQRWPHVAEGTAPNEVQAVVSGDVVSIRINRELLWEGALSVQASKIGIFIQSFGEAATVDFQQLSLFTR